MPTKTREPLKPGSIVNGFTVIGVVNKQLFDVLCPCGKRTRKSRANMEHGKGCNACKPRKVFGYSPKSV